MLFIRRSTPKKLAQLLDENRDKAHSYADVGASQGGGRPSGTYRTVQRRAFIGNKPGTLEAAIESLETWAPQKRAGLIVLSTEPFEVGTVVIQAAALLGQVRVVAPCRVVYIERDENNYAYAYGTLEGHPESGEERFAIIREPDGWYFQIDAFANAGHWLTKIGGSVAWRIQGRALDKYVEAVLDACR